MVCGCTYIVYSLCESCRLFFHRRLVARISGRCTPAMPSDLAIFPTGGFGPDPPRPAPPNFRNAIGLCHFSAWQFRPVGSPTPPDPPHQTSAMPSDFAIFPTGGFGRSAPRPPQTRPTKLPQCHRTLPFFRQPLLTGPPRPPPSPNFCNAIRLPTGHLSLSQCHYFRRRPYLGNGSSERPAM